MEIMTRVLIVLILLPIILIALEVYLCKKKVRFALILPIIVACFFIILGFYALMLAGILFAIYFVMNYLDKEKEAKLTELEKMNIQDLE